MDVLVSTYRQLLVRREYVLSCASGALMMTGGMACMIMARAYLLKSSMHAVSPPDLFLDAIPAIGMENLLAWGIPILTAFIAGSISLYPERAPYFMKTLGVLLLIRSFFVILTPMGIRPDQVVTSPVGFFQNLAYSSNDFFFSGHVSLPFLCALIFWNERWIRNIFIGFSLLFAVSVLLEHTHYSIDVFAVPFIIPTIERLARFLFAADAAYAIDQKTLPARKSSFPLFS